MGTTQFGLVKMDSALSKSASALYGPNRINGFTAIEGARHFPGDLFDRADITQYAEFRCTAKEYIDWTGNRKKTDLGSIFLPLPRDLSSSYRSNWSSEEGGIWGKGVKELDKGSLISRAASGEDFSDMQNMIPGMARYASASKIHQFHEGKDAGAAYRNAQGEIMNPMNLLNFNAPDFRNFSFTWELVPSSGSESETLNRIIFWLKKLIHSPMESGATSVLKFPPLWNINFVTGSGGNGVGNKFLFQARECAITEVTVDYNTKGNAYHRSGLDGQGYQAPNGIKLTVSFTETEILTQKDFKSPDVINP